jgi:hypothetical protein
LHDRASVFVDDEVWYLLVHTTCRHLRDDNLCGIYETRPQICRDYTTDACEYEDDWVYDKYFETPEQIAEYAEALMPRRDEVNRVVYDALDAFGGSISAEHGIGRMKRDELLATEPAVGLELMRRVKRAFDPAGIMNPGKTI